MVHQYWMRRFADPALFTDALTAELRGSERYPDGYQALFWLASHVADPIVFGEWLGGRADGRRGLAGLRDRPRARRLAAGGLDRRRAVLGTAGAPLLRRLPPRLPPRRGAADRAAGAAAPGAGGRARRGRRRAVLPAGRVPRGRRAVRLRAALGRPAAGPRPAAGAHGRARRRPRHRRDLPPAAAGQRLVRRDVGGRGAPLPRVRRARRPALLHRRRWSTTCARTAVASTCGRPAACCCSRPSACCSHGGRTSGGSAAKCSRCRSRRSPPTGSPRRVLFTLYLPHRYTYPLLAFCAIAIAVTLLPTWQALADRPLARVLAARRAAAARLPRARGVPARPAAPALPGGLVGVAAAGGARARRPVHPDARTGALACGLALLLAVVALPGRVPPGQGCPSTPAMRYLASLPKDAVVAGDPGDLKCVPVTASRAVVISTQLASSYERGYFLDGPGADVRQPARVLRAVRLGAHRADRALRRHPPAGQPPRVAARARRRASPLARRPLALRRARPGPDAQRASRRACTCPPAAAAGTTARRPSTTSLACETHAAARAAARAGSRGARQPRARTSS